MDSESLKNERKRRLHWLSLHGYKATGKFTWKLIAPNYTTYKLTLNANRYWYCQASTYLGKAFGDGRTPWAAEFNAYKRLGGQNQS